MPASFNILPPTRHRLERNSKLTWYRFPCQLPAPKHLQVPPKPAALAHGRQTAATHSAPSGHLGVLQREQLKLMVDSVGRADTWEVFRLPVTTLLAPDYFHIITRPMDLKTVRNKLAAGSYTDVYAVKHDMDLIFANCERYNAIESDVAKYGGHMKRVWRNQWRESGLDTVGQESKSAAKRPRSDSDGEPETKAARTGGGGLSCVAAQASRSAQISTHRAQVAAPKPAPTSSHSVKRCHAKHETTGQQILARTSNPAAAQPSAETAAKAATKKAKNAAKKAEKAAAEISAKKAAKATAQAPPQPAAETAPRPRYDPLKDYFPPTRVESLAEYIENLIGLNDEKQQWELVEFLENMLPIPLTPAKDGTVPLDLSALSWVSLWKLDKFLLCNSGGQYKPVILWLVPRTCSSTGLIYAEDDEDTDDELDMYRRI